MIAAARAALPAAFAALAWVPLAGFAQASAAPAAVPEAPPVWQLHLHRDQHSDALPLARLGDDDWRQLKPRAGRNLAYLYEELRLQRRAGDWTLALLARSYATLVASDQALELAARAASGQRPALDRHSQVDVQLRAFSGAGLALGRSLALAPGWTAGLSVQVLSLGHWRERSITGPVSFDAANQSYSFALQSQDNNDRLRFPFQQAFARQGAGLLLGVELAWSAGPWRAQLALRDGGWLRWRGLPQQQASLTTNVTAVDVDGFTVYGPLVQGQNAQTGLTRWLSWRGQLTLDYALTDSQQLGLALDTVPGYGVLPVLRWQQRTDALRLGLDWRVHERRATLSLAWQGLSLRAGADRLGADAHSRELELSYAQEF